MDKLKKVAREVMNLSYGDMTDMGRALCGAAQALTEEGMFDVDSDACWASILHGWAEGKLDE